MKVVVVGGYGVFGGRLARLLVRDGHEVWISGRSEARAATFAGPIGARALRFDRTGDLDALDAIHPDALVDAAGPFQTYGSEGLQLAAACVARGIHYLDFSDDGAFTRRIETLDAQATAAGCFALSGVSSVPGLSSIAAAQLTDGLTDVALLESAILPGNRAPRGQSLITNIVSQAGAPLDVWRGGRWHKGRGWSERRTYVLEAGLSRPGWVIGVPDLVLFPSRFKARSVLFRAGTELRVFNSALALVAWARRMGWSLRGSAFPAIAHRLSQVLEPFGSDTGGMVVRVVGTSGERTLERSWRLVARNGDGPFVPGVVARAILRNPDAIRSGARACLAECSMPAVLDALADLSIDTHTDEREVRPLFRSVLGAGWGRLPGAIRRLHTVWDRESWSGEATVERGRGLLARLCQALFRFPRAGENVPVAVTLTRTPEGELWDRDFGGRVFRSHLRAGPRAGILEERFGPFRFDLALRVDDEGLHFPVIRGRVLGIPLPKRCLPTSETREAELGGQFSFDVQLGAPFGLGLIVRYRGTLRPDREFAPATAPRSSA
jgi:NAD(P)-dependent dehydrogenase (short-subunit alcohol dehydrogenase family)